VAVGRPSPALNRTIDGLTHVNATYAPQQELCLMQDTIGHFPARLLTPDEHALVAEWLSLAGDVAAAYVSNRRDDDPAYYRRIVVVTKPEDGASHLVHAPAGSRNWVVFTRGPEPRMEIFATLRAALNSICPVLTEPSIEADPAKPKG
jgi:hypothetical protein